jgi:hypothetical protein
MAHGCVWLGLKIMLRLRSHNRGPHKAGGRRQRSCISILWELIGIEDIIQGIPRCRFIEIGSAIAQSPRFPGRV